MKVFKSFFNRSIVVFSIILQCLFLYLIFSTYRAYFLWERIISATLGFLIFLQLISKNTAPEFKLPWLVMFMLFPIMGFLLYVLFGNTKPSILQVKFLNALKEDYASVFPKNKRNAREKEELLGKYAGVEKYLENSLNTSGFLNSSVDYFASGEEMLEDLLRELEGAKEFIFLESFIIKEGVMWSAIHSILRRKVKAGVEVRVLYDDIGTVGKLVSGYYKTLNKEGINCKKFNPVKPLISGIYNNRDHKKIIVIDGIIGYTGGVNVADEYINETHPFGYWKDSVVKVKGEAVFNMTFSFLSTFDSSTKKLSVLKNYYKPAVKESKGKGYVHPFSCGPEKLYRHDVARQNLINMISVASKSVFITTPYLIIDSSLSSALSSASLKGIDVRIVIPKIPDKKIVYGMTKSTAEQLRKHGVKIYFYTPGFIHAKQVLIDGEFAFVGTINLDYRSLAHHYENGVVTYKTKAVRSIKKDFSNLFKVSLLADGKNSRVNKFTRLINTFLSVFRPLF